ncbi:MAG: carboxymuconolactone decarboxylase family protein [Burkholderiales bacterium]
MTAQFAAMDRMPPLRAEQMTDAQKQAAAEISAGPRGSVFGPFVPLLRSPEFMTRLQKTGEYLRFNNSLGPRLGELVILITARRWSQQFEWSAHYPLALKAGLRAEVADAVADGRRPSDMREDEEAVYDFCDELARTQGVSDSTYARALSLIREQGVIDMIGTTGYYTTLAMIMNVARTPLPEGATPALKPFPR